MDRTEFIIIISFLVLTAFVLGWICCWIYQVLTRRTASDEETVMQISDALASAEADRDRAINLLRRHKIKSDNGHDTDKSKYQLTPERLKTAKDS